MTLCIDLEEKVLVNWLLYCTACTKYREGSTHTVQGGNIIENCSEESGHKSVYEKVVINGL